MSSTDLLGILGGSFDPPHRGHLALARFALELLREGAGAGTARIIVVPSGRHPFGKALSSGADRLEMCRLAFAEMGDAVAISDDEIAWAVRHEGEASYMVDTLRRLARQTKAQLRLILGSDIFAERHRWHQWDEIEALAPPLWIARTAGGPAQSAAADTADNGHSIHVPARPLPAVSSTSARLAAESGEDLDSMVIPEVARFIEDRRLYG